MKRIEVQAFGGPEQLTLVEQPDPTPRAGEVLVAVKAAGINFADVMSRAGTYPGVPNAPFAPGFEVAGDVVALGEGVSGLKVGDRVMGLLGSGGYTTHAVLDAASAVPLPAELGYAEATALLVQGLTAFFLLEEGDFKPGKAVLVPGAAGGVGSLAIQLARLGGAGQIIGLASLEKHTRVLELGADAAFDYRSPGWSRAVLKATGERGVDLFLDSQGDLAGECFDTLGVGAHWMLYGGQGANSKGLRAERLGAVIGKGLTLRGYMLQSSAMHFKRGLAALLQHWQAGELKLDVETFPLAEAARAHAAIEGRKTVGKVALVP